MADPKRIPYTTQKSLDLRSSAPVVHPGTLPSGLMIEEPGLIKVCIPDISEDLHLKSSISDIFGDIRSTIMSKLIPRYHILDHSTWTSCVLNYGHLMFTFPRRRHWCSPNKNYGGIIFWGRMRKWNLAILWQWINVGISSVEDIIENVRFLYVALLSSVPPYWLLLLGWMMQDTG